MKLPRAIQRERWLGKHRAFVIAEYTERGSMRFRAYVEIPSTKGSDFRYFEREKNVRSYAGGWKWINEMADKWAKENGVTFYV